MNRPDALDLATRPIINRNPWGAGEPFPRSETVLAPAAILEDSETMTQWSPFGTLYAQPFRGGWDALSQADPEGSLMAVPQADFYDPSANPWPNNGQFDHPNKVALEAVPMLAQAGGIPRESSAHRGFAETTRKGDPTSLFHAPPVFSVQTKPIPAVGL